MEISFFILAMMLSFAVFLLTKKLQYSFGLLPHLTIIAATSILATDALFNGVSAPPPLLVYIISNPIYLVVDKLSAFFALVVNFTILTAILYASGYLKLDHKKEFKAVNPAEIFPENRNHGSNFQKFLECRIFNFNTHQLIYAANDI